MDDLKKRIQNMSLTRTDAEIAEYILAHFDTIGFQTSTTLAESIGVSDTSVIRFIRKLGFKGYSEFRAEMNKRAARQIRQSESGLMPGEKYARSLEQLNPSHLLYDVSQYTVENLRRSYDQLDQASRVPGDCLLRPVHGQQAAVFDAPRGPGHPCGRHCGGECVGYHREGLPVPIQLSPLL